NRWIWGTAAIIVLWSALPAASAARMRRVHLTPRAYHSEAPRSRVAPTQWPRPEVLDLAMRAYRCGRAEGQVDSSLLTVIDYSLPSTEKRLWVIDLAKRRVLFHELVAHGQNSGEEYAVEFSNRPQSRQSSLGLFRTDDVYDGRHGASLRLIGLEP